MKRRQEKLLELVVMVPVQLVIDAQPTVFESSDVHAGGQVLNNDVSISPSEQTKLRNRKEHGVVVRVST